ncbi:MAG: hypothetical protein KZQ60_02070 [Candidatus Thiodiazotropha sp. (ex Lucinoma aequizonata)]|nr:hypothetical protein [Candidatus Thiodiazotropha sp. (ex Lucinoma aequizonata)]MCU7889690.1 hypothetical protein [Candidatus Thiodiazotropha sp. (ex Lucinoma aequizonata)]MCU7896531.1 hypothetical protein [Candidatus Thiodiazotropha sp. (ex Lucinoma aequizonata)]MCU7909699.1 hypothetical protein [Candidatus Thiodiazotropha sp. (ex Lucinoma aequizonata)]MCU7911798.1 hypothetical protein [Candidatus Thiodiazotropha sp. (ex Lucinoma aequizonata)]
MRKNNVVKLRGRDTISDSLTELLRTGAERLIYQAVEVELLELLAEHSERRTQACLRSRERFWDIPVHQNRLDL